jgi:hypothetical protein
MSMSQFRQQTAPVLLVLILSACSQHEQPAAPGPAPATGATPATPGSRAVPALDVQLISERLGTAPRALPGGALSVMLPRSGMSVKVEGTPIAGALNTELLFQPAADGAAVSGSVELLEDEVSPVLDTLLAHGIRVVGLYNRFLYDEPRVLVLRFEGQGNPALLASGVQSISSVLRDARLRSSQPSSALPGEPPEPGTLDAVALGSVLGVTATVSDGLLSLEVPRPPQAVPAPGTPWGPLLRATLSGSDLHAALSGTFMLAARELVATLAALRRSNVHLVGLVPQDTPGDTRWFAVHFRGKNNSLALVSGLALALQARADAR